MGKKKDKKEQATQTTQTNGQTTSNGTQGQTEALTVSFYNYSVLLRHDPHLAQLFVTSSICNVYRFNIEKSEWDKTNIQGTLFIYSRVAKEGLGPGNTGIFPYGLMVLNRLSLEDFTLGITPEVISSRHEGPEVAVEMEGNFIMIQAADGVMYGLWVFDETDRQLVLSTLQHCIAPAPAAPVLATVMA